MDRHLSLQTYVPRPLADWIKGKARDQQVSVSIVIRDQLIDAWQRENEARKRPGALDPVRQNLFITVALEALLVNLTDNEITVGKDTLDRQPGLGPQDSHLANEGLYAFRTRLGQLAVLDEIRSQEAIDRFWIERPEHGFVPAAQQGGVGRFFSGPGRFRRRAGMACERASKHEPGDRQAQHFPN